MCEQESAAFRDLSLTREISVWNRPTVVTLLERYLARCELTEVAMPKPSPRQRKTMGRVMHEFKHGELKSGPAGKVGKVKSRRQAIAIALKEAGASKYESESENKRNLANIPPSPA
jgi:hypothetical protein